MSDPGRKHAERRRKLKTKLYKLLKDEPKGIPKAYLWNTFHSKTKEPVAAHYYGISKMHNILDKFDDMVKEVMHRGQPTIRLLDGYVPSDEDDHDDNDVQVPQVSSSKKSTGKSESQVTSKAASTTKSSSSTATEKKSLKSVENRDNEKTDNQTLSQDEHRSDITASPGGATSNPLGGSVSTQLQFGGPSLFLPSQVQSTFIPLQIPGVTRNIPLMSLQSPRQVQVQLQQLQQQQLQQQQLQQQQLLQQQQQFQQKIAQERMQQALKQQQEAGSLQQHKVPLQGKDQQHPDLITVSDSDSSSGDEYPSLQESLELKSKPKKSDMTSADRERIKVKQSLVELLKGNPKGIKKAELWDRVGQVHGIRPKKAELHVNKLSDLLPQYSDVIEEFRDDLGIEYVILKGMRKRKGSSDANVAWGQGIIVNRSLGDKRALSSSTSSLDSTSSWGAGSSFIKPVTRPVQENSLIDLTGDVATPQRSQQLGQLTTDQQNSGFISLTPGPSPGHMGPPMSSTPMRTTEGMIAPPRRDSLLDLTSSSGRQIDTTKFEDRQITVNPYRLPRGQNHVTRDQLESVAQECIEILSDANQYVCSERVEKLVLQKFRVNHISNLGLRYIGQLNCVNELCRTLSRINAYIDAFIRVRSICTLAELRHCLKEYAPNKEDFASLKVGPIQRLPLIYEKFKFPPDIAEVPSITTIDILEHLRNYMNRYQKWTEKLVLEEFMNYLVEEHGVENAYILGVRIISLPLAAHVLKKSQRDAGMTTRSVTESMKEETKKEIQAIFNKFRASIMQSGSDGSMEVRKHYLQIRPETAITEIFQKFQLLMASIERPTARTERRRYQKFEESIHSFIESVRMDDLGTKLFHLAVCISNTELQEAVFKLLAPRPEQSQQSQAPKKQPPVRDAVVTHLKKYLASCMNQGAISLRNFDQIEKRLLEDFDFPSFQDMGVGRFLEFLLREAKQTLEECGGTVLGAASGHQEGDGGFIPKRTEILEFIDQCGKMEPPQIELAICEQFCVKDLKHLGHGNINRLTAAASAPGKHKSSEHLVVYEASLLDTSRYKQQAKGQIGILGHQTKEAALACLHNCPLLENIGSWSQWALVFEPELGKLKDFIQKYGGLHTSYMDGGSKIMTTDISALEVRPGQFLKLVTQTSPEKLQSALLCGDTVGVCGHLMSLVVCNKGHENTPLVLLANYVKEALYRLHAETSSQDTPGAPPFEQRTTTDKAVTFVLESLVRLPLRSCAMLASQIFLDPLGQVVGSTRSKSLLLQACQTVSQRNCLQELGCLLGISEWTQQIQAKCLPPKSTLEDIPSEEVEEFFRDDTVEIEESEDDSDSESSSDSSFLSDLEDDDKENVDKIKDAIVVEETQDSTHENMDVEDETSKSDEGSLEAKKTKTETETAENKATDTPEEEAKETDTGESDADSTSEKEEETNSDDTPLTPEQKRERECKAIVDQIRRDEFGIGVELNEDGQRLMAVQQERLGRSLDRLSKDLYSKDTHFVLELVQNADDNSYPEELFDNNNSVCPTVKFMMTADGIVVLNNEVGFEEKNIRALCDVGRSTKGKHKLGYIGQKGIGFKSVFRVTDGPEVHSNGFHIKFDVKSGPTGYILPHWCEDASETGEEGWKTKIALPLKDEMKSHFRSLASRFNDIHPSLLLFLNRLHQITVENQVENSVQTMRRRNLGNNIIEIQHSDGKDRWLVIRKMLDASKISLQAKSGIEVESTEIALAFPLKPQGQKTLSWTLPPKQPVFAFLPLRSYGFRFIVQGDFDVPSSREDVDKDSAWNQWIRNEIHILFIDALEAFKNLPDVSVVEAVTAFLQFVPAEDEILDFFRPVAAQILKKLRAKPCVPTQPNSQGNYYWKIPSQTVTVKDPLIHEVVTPELLKENLNLYYLRRDVASMLNPALSQCLGIESLTTEHLLQVGKSLFLNWEKGETVEIDKRIITTAKWLACVYRSLDDFQDNQEVYDKLKVMKIIFLTSGEPVAVVDKAVFFPLSDDISKMSYRDPMRVLQQDLNTIHSLMLNTPDSEVNSQVKKILLRMGVCQLSPKDVISSHILPVLTSDRWQEKSREILVSYVTYIKEQLEKDPSLMTFDTLATVIRLQTNQGIKNPKETPIHFTPVYSNMLNLQMEFPGYEWTLLDSVYVQYNTGTTLERQQWRHFFSQLGVTDFIAISQQNVEVSGEAIKSLPWAPLIDIWGELPDGTYVNDWGSKELYELITNNKHPDTYQSQMRRLCALLDQDWHKVYSNYTTCHLCAKDGQRTRECDTSFSIYLRTLSWLPAVQSTVWMDKDQVITYEEKISMMPPHCLYRRSPEIEQYFAHTVLYLDFNIQNGDFGKFLKLKDLVEVSKVKKCLEEWGKRENQDVANVFCTTLHHIVMLYQFLSQNLPIKEIQDLILKNPVIFVPMEISGVRYNSHGGKSMQPPPVIAWRMLRREEVWWEDRSGLFRKYKKVMEEYHTEISKKSTIGDIYPADLSNFFRNGQIPMEPELTEYGELLILIGQVLSPTDPSVLSDVLKLYILFGEKGRVLENDPRKETKLFVINTERERLMRQFKGQKILITKDDKFVSIEDRPLIADNKELEKMFKQKSGVHFLQLEEKSHQTIRGRNKSGRDSKSVSMDQLEPFLQMCEIQKLSDIISTTPITDLFQPCPKLQYYVHLAVPYIQMLLYNKCPEVYQHLMSDNFVEMLRELQFFQVSKLEVRYSLENRGPEFDILKTEKCLIDDKNFYFHKDHVESYVDINREIAKYFSSNDSRCASEIKFFLMEFSAVFCGQLDRQFDDLKETHDFDEPLPPEEVVWEVQPPVQPVFQQPLIVEEPPDDVLIVSADMEIKNKPRKGEKDDSEPRLVSWPPMSHEAGSSGAKQKRDSSSQDDKQKESKVWPPPKAPDYLKSVRELPSQFKMAKDVPADDKMSESGGEKPKDRTAGEGDNTADRPHTRQEGEDSTNNREGVKRKILESDQLSGTTKRQNSSEGSSGNRQDGDKVTQNMSRSNSQVSERDAGARSGGQGSSLGHHGHVNSNQGDGHHKTEDRNEHQGIIEGRKDEQVLPSEREDNYEEERSGNTAKRRHATGDSNSSQSPPSPKKPARHMDDPLWSEFASEYTFEELGSGASLKLPPANITLGSGMSKPEIGRWGELLVYQYLLQQMDLHKDVVSVKWCNEDEEEGKPYDLEVTVDTGSELHSLFIEVKSTESDTKDLFEISSQQVLFAQEQKEQFCIYRVFNAGDSKNVRLVRIDNLSLRLDQKQVKLCMLI